MPTIGSPWTRRCNCRAYHEPDGMNPKNLGAKTRRFGWAGPMLVIVLIALSAGDFAISRMTADSTKKVRVSPAAGAPATWVTVENQRPGTANWRIATSAYGGVEGYANRVSARVGD